MNEPRPITACLIIIGNEILSGRTRDANLAMIGKRCDRLGISLSETRIIPDIEDRISEAVNTCRRLFNYVFTTGGIGPTHDDITSASVARAFNVKLERNSEAVKALDDYYDSGQLTEARLKMAEIPVGARLIDNPVSGAPGFQLENVFVFPGVPLILEAMFEGMVDRLMGGSPTLTDSITTNLAESVIAAGLGRLQKKYPRMTIGSYPYFKQGKLGVNLVLRSTDNDMITSAGDELKNMIKGLGGSLLNEP